MKKISVAALKPGLIFSEPVFIDGENILVPAGAEIKKKDIDRLNSWGVTEVQTNGKLLVLAEKSAEKTAEKPAAKPADKTAEKPAAKPAAKTPAQPAPAAAKKNAEPKSAGAKPAAPKPPEPKPAEQKAAEQKTEPPKPGDKKSPSVISLTEVQENKGSYRTYIELIERLDMVFIDLSTGVSVETRSIDNITGRLLQAVRDQRNSMIGYILGGEVTGYELAKS